jgi:large repetitive protein
MPVSSPFIYYVNSTAYDLRKVSSAVQLDPSTSGVRFIDNPANALAFDSAPFLAAWKAALDASEGGGGGGGSVTSVGLSLPSIFTITVSPITTVGSLTAVLAPQAANLLFAGPTTGVAAAPTFRSLVVGDLPAGIPNANLANSSITVAGNATALGGSVTQDQITGLSTTGLIKRTAANTLAIATSGSDYLLPNGSGAALTGITSGQVSGLTAWATKAYPADVAGLLRNNGSGTLSWDTATYLTANQTITLSNDATGSGTTSISVTLASVITAGGPIGSSSIVPVITYDAKGRLTTVTTAAITPASIGALSGAGAADQLAYWSGASTLTSNSGVTIPVVGGDIRGLSIVGSTTSTTSFETLSINTGSTGVMGAGQLGSAGAFAMTMLGSSGAGGAVNALRTTTTATPNAASAGTPRSISSSLAINTDANLYTSGMTGVGIFSDVAEVTTATSGVSLAGLNAFFSRTSVTNSAASGSTTVTTVYGQQIAATFTATNAGVGLTIATFTGLRINAPTISGAGTVSITNNYGIYQQDPDASNFFAGRVDTPASTTSTAGLRLPHGTAPTTPVNGDMWTATSGLFMRVNGSTVGPINSTILFSQTQTVTMTGNAQTSLLGTGIGSVTIPANYLTAGKKIRVTALINTTRAGVHIETYIITFGTYTATLVSQSVTAANSPANVTLVAEFVPQAAGASVTVVGMFQLMSCITPAGTAGSFFQKVGTAAAFDTTAATTLTLTGATNQTDASISCHSVVIESLFF